jgi:L-amino acid N-acyltransferase YncA
MNIRIATLNDIDSIVDIYNQAIQAGKKTADTAIFSSNERIEWFKSHTKDKYPLFVAVVQDKILAYYTISAYRSGRTALNKTAEVSYYVHFRNHNKGIGSILLQHAISICPSLGIETLIAILLECNTSSIKLLEKNGFTQWGCMPKIAEINGVFFDHLYYGCHLKRCKQLIKKSNEGK